MKKLAPMVGLLIAALGLTGLVAPATGIAIAESSTTPLGIWIVTELRLAAGIILILAARTARWALAVRILGIVLLIVGIATPFLGMRLGRALLDRGAAAGEGSIRLVACTIFAMGLLIAWAASPSSKTATS